jgi:hypothetical protein
MVFWMAGLLVGCVKARRNIYCQFLFLLMLYFIGVTIVNISDAGGEVQDTFCRLYRGHLFIRLAGNKGFLGKE